MSDTEFVNVSYHGLEIGNRLELSEFGPTTAYLEHPSPLPVGTSVQLETDDGHSISATVLRVQEQVSGSDHRPGMRLRAELAGDVQSWWTERVTCQDPVIPEIHVSPTPVPADSDEHDLHPDTEVAATMPVDPDEEPEPEPEPGNQGRARTKVMDAVSQEELRAMSQRPIERRSTAVMSTEELSEITKHAADEPKPDTDPGLDSGNGKPKKKRRRRSRKKKTS